MNRNVLTILAIVILAFTTAFAQEQTKTTTTTVTKAVQNSDGTYTVIEYPAGKEVTVTLNPVALTGAKGTATILRDDNGTKIKLNLTGVPAEVTSVNLYAVDQTGKITSLGPIAINSGAGTFDASTPLSSFMLVASPEANLAAYDANTQVFFRSNVPEGFVVIPYASSGERKGAAVGERVAATTAPVTATTAAPVTATTTTPATARTTAPAAATAAPVTATTVTATTTAPAAATAAPAAATTVTATTTAPATAAAPVTATAAPAAATAAPVTATTTAPVTATTTAPTYQVPMLNIPGFRKGTDTHLKINFTGAMTGARANVSIEPRKDGPSQVQVRFHELKEAPSGQVYVLWAVAPDNKFVKLGQIVNAAGRNEAEIRSETALPDFGLLITMENATALEAATMPAGPTLGVFEINK